MTFAIIGNDARLVKLSSMLDHDKVRQFGIPSGTATLKEAVRHADVIVCPIPLVRNGVLNINDEAIPIEALLAAMSPGQTLFAGMISHDVSTKMQESGVTVIDYADNEALQIKNAIPSAEAAIELALSYMTITLHNSRSLVIGHGRIGKILARLLTAFGSHVDVSARKPGDMAWITANGNRALQTDSLNATLAEYDVIFNTVPHRVLDKEAIALLKPSCVVLDLASEPGGVDMDIARKRGIQCEWALGLPGKHAPDTAALNLRDMVYSTLSEGL